MVCSSRAGDALGEPHTADRSFEKKGDATKWRKDKKTELRTGTRVEAVKVGARLGLTLDGMFDELAGTLAKEFRDWKWVKNGSSPQTVLTKLHRWRNHVEGTPIAILSAAKTEGKSSRNGPTGSLRQIRAVRLGLDEQFKEFFKPYPVVKK
jgi:hypothetical protein